MTLTLRATDTSSAIASTLYRFNGSKPTSYTGPFTVSGEGTTTIAYWSVDASPQENVEVEKTELVRIDRSPPTVLSDATSEYAGSARIRVRASDPHSGVAFLQVRIDGESTRTVTGDSAELFTTRAGLRSISYLTEDRLGHSAAGTIVFVVKGTQRVVRSPAAAEQTLVRRGGSATWRFAVTVTSSASKPLAGKLVYLQRSSNGATWGTVTKLTTNAQGKASYSRVFRSAYRAYWRWYSPGTATLAAGSSTRTRVVVR